jgi:D-glycero-D-manno-heptose 1,7-bisphosphate phosphatase
MGLLCLDLDGTLVDDALIEEDGKLQRPQDQLFHEPVLRPNVFEVIDRSALEGDRFAIITNQGGVAWGYHTQAEVRQRISRAVALLDFFRGRPFSVHVAWDHPRATVAQFRSDKEEVGRRKPGPAMILEAIDRHIGIGTSSLGLEVIMVGDRPEDEEAAKAASVDFSPAGDFFAW